MKVCNIIGCHCEGRKEGNGRGHYPRKAYEGGFTYYAASYGPRYGDPVCTYVALAPSVAIQAAEEAASWEEEEIRDACTYGGPNCDCELCHPDICVYGEFTYRVKDLFSPKELMEHRRDLLAGRAVALDR